MSLSFPDVEFHSVRRYYKVTREGHRESFFGFKDEVDVIEEAEVPKALEMVKKIERRGILRDGDVIKVRSEEDIYIDGDKLPAPKNIPVPEEGSQTAQRIFNGEFGHNGL